MEYAFTVYDSIAAVPADDWARLRTPGDLATDPRLIQCAEEGLAGQGRCWVVVARDGSGDVAAGACLVLFRVDAAETTGPVVRGATAAVRRVWPGALRFGVMFCGLPAPSGDGQLRIVPGADVGAVMRGLDRVIGRLARAHGAGMAVIKELDEAATKRAGTVVESLGYLRGEVPAVYVLERSFANFDAYCGQLRTDYRRRVLRSVKKMDGTGFEVEYLRGAEIEQAYTDGCHRLYEAVWEKAAYRLEKWPAEFFRNVARRFGGQASMTRILARDGRPMAWAFGVTDGGVYHNLYGGLDYSMNGEFDLYFNLYFRDLDRAFRDGARAINLGQTADWFKARLGAVASPRYFFARGVRPWVQFGLRAGRRWAFPPVATQPEQHVFRNGATAEGAPPGQRAGEPGSTRGPEAGLGVKPRPSPPPRPGERTA